MISGNDHDFYSHFKNPHDVTPTSTEPGLNAVWNKTSNKLILMLHFAVFAILIIFHWCEETNGGHNPTNCPELTDNQFIKTENHQIVTVKKLEPESL